MLSPSYFQPFILHHFTTGKHTLGPCADATRSDTPCMGFKTATSSGRSVQIVSISVGTYRGPVAIDVFLSLISTLYFTKIQLCKVNAYFPLDCTIIVDVRNCFCLTKAVSLCGKMKRRRRLHTLPDDRTN